MAGVFVNGIFVGKHTGSYTAFSFRITDAITFADKENKENIIIVKVENNHNEDIPPLSGDFTMFGGIYRDVYLNVLPKIHFDADNHASTGVFISTPTVTATNAEIRLKGLFENKMNKKMTVEIHHDIFDAEGKLFKKLKKQYKAAAGEKINFVNELKNVTDFHLWSVDHPYLYRVVSSIIDTKSGETIDRVSNPLGFRWFKFDADQGFFLNGKHVKLMGASRHQDYKGQGNALPNSLHVRDVELLKEMGGNFLRIAHYPQDPEILLACDRLGILATVETPIVNQITETEAFSNNAKNMHIEMIRQAYNHPSLIAWAYMNEVLLRPRFEKDSDRQEEYFRNITKLAHELDSITRSEDPNRYTMIANHRNFSLYKRLGLTSIPQLIGWNVYSGWYSGTLDGFADFLDQHHRELPDKPLLITEYGADADNRLHCFTPERFDKTVEYTQLYHEKYLEAMNKRDFVAAGLIWNLAEFSSEQRGETTPHINAKGIMTQDRQPKNSYYFYQANLLKTPFLKIGDKEWTVRTGFATSETRLICKQPVIVFSNQPQVTLYHNSKVLDTQKTMGGVARFDIPFTDGLNSIMAVSKNDDITVNDVMGVHFRMLSQNLRSREMPFRELNVSLGDKRFFYDEKADRVWIPEQEYTVGSWGFTGGQIYTRKNSTRQSYGTDKNIQGTDLDPVYATQRTGIEHFRFDVTAGDYLLTLHFAELNSTVRKTALVYNLDSNRAEDEPFAPRIFDVLVNNVPVLSNLSNTEELIPEKAISFDVPVSVNNIDGIVIDFKAIEGQTILNGIQLRKLR